MVECRILFNSLWLFIIIPMFYGRKPCDMSCRKLQYQNHIKKLQAVKTGKSPFHRSFQRQRKEIDQLLKVSHQMHNTSLKEQFKRRQLTELESHRRSYNNVRSIVKSELNRKILPVPSRHKPNTYFLDIANLKLIDKIVNVKSQFDFKRQTLQKIATQRIRNQTNQDYSDIYQRSFINHQKRQQIYLKIGKEKVNHRINFRFMGDQPLECFKQDALFVIELQTQSRTKLSKLYLLEDILKSQIHITFPSSRITLNFFEKIGEKMVKRFILNFSQEEIVEEKVWTSKAIEDTKNRVIGLVEVQLKKKKEKIHKGHFYDEIIRESQQKQKQISKDEQPQRQRQNQREKQKENIDAVEVQSA